MDRRRNALLAAGVALGLLMTTTACGIPEDGPVVPLGLQKFDPASGYTGGGEQVPSTRADESVANFLKAAAGDPAKRQNRLERFMADNKKEQRWGEIEGLPLIDDVNIEPVNIGKVRVTGKIIATYTLDGQILPPETGNTDIDLTYLLTQDPKTDLWLFSEAPTQILLTVAHFRESYAPAPIYFLNKPDHHNVVADTRYLFNNAPPEQKTADLLLWLVAGPSQAMKPFVYTAVPPNTNLNSADMRADGTVVVDLDSGAANIDTTLIRPQLAWTLRSVRTELIGGFDLQVDSISRVTGSLVDSRATNLASSLVPRDLRPRVITEGTVQPPVPGVPAATYQGLRYAVPNIAAGKTILVSPEGVRVVKPLGEGQVPKNPDPTSIKITDLPPGEVGRPTWLSDSIVLIPVAGKVYAAALGDKDTTKASSGPVMNATVGRIAMSPDGARLAYTSGGRAHWAAIQENGDGTVTVGAAHDLGPDMTQVRDVGWSRQDRVAITGVSSDKQHLVEYSLDNVFVKSVEDLGSASELDELAVKCADPWNGPGTVGDLYVTVGDTVYQSSSGASLTQYRPEPADTASSLKGRGLFLQ
ncbi:hypothetical protein Afil01_10560 [Actinorhabdospora filicis]|uniref:Sporulation and spore germination protein n=1 Tax=Actinorhabdospora filicis TaxID=1785913 RepID=A0A9W6W769_9ACTN|nr:LpqB family beta-propeller domain-containing protein [Actinorhabdospora filicis]GLZ76249.1 hypothetical protein Afil01_10560 [Actinorhabdospora filicis]